MYHPTQLRGPQEAGITDIDFQHRAIHGVEHPTAFLTVAAKHHPTRGVIACRFLDHCLN
jgi:hypothetical protein